MYDRLDKNFFSIVQKYEYDVKVSRTRTFVRGQRRIKVRPCGRTFTKIQFSRIVGAKYENNTLIIKK